MPTNDVARLCWSTIEASLDSHGYAVTPPLLSKRRCEHIASLYDDDDLFRSTVVMQRHQFGVGEYRYFGDPVPAEIEALRADFYRPLAGIANTWRRALGLDEHYPAEFSDYRTVCHSVGQCRPTPLLLRYAADGYNCLHQDKYGEEAFPLQAVCMLGEPGKSFDGGEFMLVENRPRMQSRGTALRPRQGQWIIFPNQIRPVRGQRGYYRVQVRHGVSRVLSGLRMTLGLIFHDAL